MEVRAAVLLIILALCGISEALVIGPRIYEQDDLGDPALSEFTYSLSSDCNASTISVYIMNESNGPVRDAEVYLKYVDFSTPLMSSTKTDKDGFTLIRLPGNVMLMRGLFILVIEKKAFRNKEVHFDLSPCWGGSQIPPKPQANQSQNATNHTTAPAPPESNASAVPPPANNTTQQDAENQSGSQSGAQEGPVEPEQPCPASAALCAIMMAAFFKSFKPR
jgi:hypothetical protein